MDKIKLIAVCLIVSFIFINGCGKKEQSTNSKDQTQTTSTQKNITQTSSQKLLKLNSASNPKNKGEAPVIEWTENDKTMSLADLKGKVVLVNLWATWCGPCVKEMPDLSKIYAELKDKGFEMIGISVMQENGGDPVSTFIQKNPVTYRIIEGDNDVVKAFGSAIGEEVNSIPRTFIIDKTGKIVEKITGIQKEKNKEHIQSLVEKYLQ